MILSFSEFNELYESINDSNIEEYSNGIDVMESLLTVMNKKGTLTETELVTFLDNVLEETGWDLNDEVYESYAEWLDDWAPFIDEGVNEDESEMLFALTQRGEGLLNEGVRGAYKHSAEFLKTHAKNMYTTSGRAVGKAGKAVWGGSKGAASGPGQFAKEFKSRIQMDKGKPGYAKSGGLFKKAGKSFGHLSTAGKIGTGITGAAIAGGAGYGAYKGIKALKKRRDDKKAVANQPPQQMNRR